MKRWKRVALWVLFLMGVSMLGLLSAIWPSVGNGPSDTDLEQYASSQNFDSSRGTFINRRHDEYEKMIYMQF